MSAKESAIEVKVGALVLFSLLLLAGFIYVLGDFSLDEGVVIEIDYANIAGLKPGAPVKQAGIQIGAVRDIDYRGTEINKQTGEPIWARVSIELTPEHADTVRRSSAFYITSEGVLGEKFVSVETLDLAGASVEDGDVFRGIDPFRIEQMVSKVNKSLDSLDALLNDKNLPIGDLIRHVDELAVNTNQIIVDNREQIASIIKHVDGLVLNADVFIQSAGGFVANADDTLTESRPRVRSILANVDLAAADARTTLSTANRTMNTINGVVNRVGGKIDPLVKSVQDTLANIRRLSSRAIKLADEAEPKLKLILDDASAAVGDVRTITGSAVEMINYVQSGRGTVGALLRDEEIFDNLREMLRELKRRPWKIVWKE